MNWFLDLLLGDSVAHAILVLSIVIAIGLTLGRWKVGGVSIGSAWILFAGIAFGHAGLVVDSHTLHFVREFGLVLFVFAIGIQVGPSFLAALRRGGLRVNLLATGTVILGGLCTVGLGFATGLPGATMVGIMSGAVTNTPGLGAAQETYADLTGGSSDASMAAGYAMTYPLAVVGIICSMVLLRIGLRIDVAAHANELRQA